VDALVGGFAPVLGLVLGGGFVADGFVSKDGMDFGFVVTTLVDLAVTALEDAGVCVRDPEAFSTEAVFATVFPVVVFACVPIFWVTIVVVVELRAFFAVFAGLFVGFDAATGALCVRSTEFLAGGSGRMVPFVFFDWATAFVEALVEGATTLSRLGVAVWTTDFVLPSAADKLFARTAVFLGVWVTTRITPSLA
jgi:hypothetical protein